MGGFDQFRDLVDDAVNEVFGETALITPRVVSQYAGATADPDRDAFGVEGIFSLAPENVRMKGQRSGEGVNSVLAIAATYPEFWISAGGYAAAGGEVRKGDLLTVTAGDHAGTYNVSDVRWPDTGDVVLLLTREKA